MLGWGWSMKILCQLCVDLFIQFRGPHILAQLCRSTLSHTRFPSEFSRDLGSFKPQTTLRGRRQLLSLTGEEAEAQGGCHLPEVTLLAMAEAGFGASGLVSCVCAPNCCSALPLVPGAHELTHGHARSPCTCHHPAYTGSYVVSVSLMPTASHTHLS